MSVQKKYKNKILDKLLDKYEGSKTFNGSNKVRQSFKVKPEIIFPGYGDHSNYQVYEAVNTAIEDLVDMEYIEEPKDRNRITEIVLIENKCDEIYKYLKRQPKRVEMMKVQEVLNYYVRDKSPIGEFARQQTVRINANKRVEIYKGDIEEFQDVLRAGQMILNNQEEIFTRDMSIKIFGESKRLEKIKDKVQRLLALYGPYGERAYILEEYGVVNAPSVLRMKGNAVLVFENQEVELQFIGGEMVFSTKSMSALKRINLTGGKVITVENLTTYYDYPQGDDLIIYLGGFHNRSKAELLKLIYSQNKDKEYLHFGDIDIGAFHIFNHLCTKTDIPFQLLHMDKETLARYKGSWIKLNKAELKRLKSLRKILDSTDCTIDEIQKCVMRDTLNYMEEQKCKLEQEVIGLELRTGC